MKIRKISLFAITAVIGVVLLSACSMLGKAADKELGVACTDQIRYVRDSLLTDMLAKHYGEEFPALIGQLRAKNALMLQAVAAGAGVDAAGDSYRAQFVVFAGALLAKRGINVALGGYKESVERLKVLPELIADINEIEARVQIACAKVPK